MDTTHLRTEPGSAPRSAGVPLSLGGYPRTSETKQFSLQRAEPERAWHSFLSVPGVLVVTT